MTCAPNRITLKTIAEHCGCSVNTVSLALRNDPRISSQTLDTVQKAADELGYIRNNLASSLRSGKSHMIAVIIEHAHNPHYTFLIDDMVALLQQHGYIPMLLFTHNSEETERRMLELTVSLSADGIILFIHGGKAWFSNTLKGLSIPVILMDRGMQGLNLDCVCVNDYEGGYLAGEKLASLGHTRFLFLAGPLLIESQIRRQNGFLDALSKYSLGKDQVRFVSYDMINDAIEANTILQMLTPIDYTAIICYNDEFAYYIMNTLRQNGYRIPEDISICGFDHICSSMPYLPPLSSISYPKDRSLAQTVVRFLLNRLERPNRPVQIDEFPAVYYEEGTVAICHDKKHHTDTDQKE